MVKHFQHRIAENLHNIKAINSSNGLKGINSNEDGMYSSLIIFDFISFRMFSLQVKHGDKPTKQIHMFLMMNGRTHTLQTSAKPLNSLKV